MSHAVFSTNSLVLLRSAESQRTFHTLPAAGRLTGVHPEMLRHYCRIGLLGEARSRPHTEPVFDDDALYQIKRIEHFRAHHGVNLRALPLVMGLAQEIDRLRGELRFQRAR